MGHRGEWANKVTEGLLLISYYLRICGGHIVVMGTSNSTDTFWPLGRFGLKEIVLIQSSTNCKHKTLSFHVSIHKVEITQKLCSKKSK